MTRSIRSTARATLAGVALGLLAACGEPTGPDVEYLGVERMRIAPELVECTTWYLQTYSCLAVRDEADQAWVGLSEGIVGFVHEPGHEYVIEVVRLRLEEPPTDTSGEILRLLRVISRTRVPSRTNN